MLTLQRYVTAVTVVGIAVLVAVLATAPAEAFHLDLKAVLLVVALVIGECVPMRIVHHGSEGEITTSATFALALLLITGVEVTMIAMTIAAVVADLRQRKERPRTLFNVGQYAIAIWVAALALGALSDLDSGGARAFGPDDLFGSTVAALAFFITNAALVARAVSLVDGAAFWRYLHTDLALQTSTVGILLGLGPILVITAEFSLLALPLLMLPLVALHRAGRQAVENQREALHDPLTGLPNRMLLHDRVVGALTLAKREGRLTAVMLVDLDGFKEINDTLGHHEGDALLCCVAERLRNALRASDTVARLGGDEFAIVLGDVADAKAACAVAQDLCDVIKRPLTMTGDLMVQVRASIGVAVSPDHGQDPETLMRHADVAMYQAKGAGGGQQLYVAEHDEASPERLRRVGELADAIENGELIMHFQPKIDLATGRIEGLEALIRWPHPRLGVLPPAQFIEMAERSGLIIPLTSFALDAAMRECRSWLSAGLEVPVAVNLSARSLRDTGVVEEVARLLEQHELPGRLLQLELTENSLVADPEAARAVLGELRKLSVTVAIDDFGTGFSSLAHLKDFPVDELKIDRRFVMNLERGSADAAIVRSTIQLAHDLGLRVVAEGVENTEALALLSELGCDAVQGYLLGRPAPAGVVGPLLERPPARALAA